MGIVEAIVTAILGALSTTAVASPILAAVLTAAVSLTIAAGLYFLSSLLTPKTSATKPSDVTASFRKAIGPRYRHYGKVKISGQWVFCAANSGSLYKVIALGQGPFTSFESFWIDSNKVTLDGSGYAGASVNLQNVASTNYGSKARILSRLGTTTQTAYSELISVFPSWSSAHAGKEVASLLCVQLAVSSDQYSSIFPNSWNTNYRVIATTTAVENPITETVAYDDNGADIIRDYLYSEYGLRLPKALLTTPLAQAGWETAHTKAAEAYSIKAGGTEKRYRIWGSYTLEERPSDVLNRMLSAVDGRMLITADGGITLDVGDYVEPTVIFTDDDIVGFSEFGHGKDILTTANVIKATFTSPQQDYIESDADEWIDEVDVLERGEISTSYEYTLAPSHSQCRRLMKLAAYRANPLWTGSFELTVKGLAALSERFVRIQYSPFGLDAVFEINKLTMNVGESNILKSVTISVTSIEQEAFNWDYLLEEGIEPSADDIVEDTVLPVPTGFDAVIQRKDAGGTQIPYAKLSWDAPVWESLYVTAQYKASSDSDWITIGSNILELFVDSPNLSDGVSYDFRIAQSTFSGKLSAFTTPITLLAISDVTAPGVVTGVSATGGAGKVVLSWTAPNSSNYVAAVINRNTINNKGTATLVRTEFGSPSAVDTWTNTGLAAGGYYYWIESRNGSGVVSASVASGVVTVT